MHTVKLIHEFRKAKSESEKQLQKHLLDVKPFVGILY